MTICLPWKKAAAELLVDVEPEELLLEPVEDELDLALVLELGAALALDVLLPDVEPEAFELEDEPDELELVAADDDDVPEEEDVVEPPPQALKRSMVLAKTMPGSINLDLCGFIATFPLLV